MLYHYQIGFPKGVALRFGTVRLTWTQHALKECQADRYGIINPPQTLDTDTAQVIEAEIEGTTVVKVVYRIPYTPLNDMVLVVLPASGLVKTVWINRKDDTHRTLDARKYATPL